MKLYEFDDKEPMNVLELLLYDLQKLIEKQNLPINENFAKDNKEYKEYITKEKVPTIPVDRLIVGHFYAPLSLSGSPTNGAISIRTTKEDASFLEITDNNIIFLKDNKKATAFPANSMDINDVTVDTLIFENQNDKTQFILSLKLKFNGWLFNMNYL